MAEQRRVVLHIDIDAFFCQVEENKRGGPSGKPIAIQQHQDIIAVNYPARAAGVTKHMRPAEVRRILHPLGGRVLPVHMEAGQRVSYGPYRAISRAMMKLLRRFEAAEVVEKASIDEAFVLLRAPQSSMDAAADVRYVRDVTACIRAAISSELGLKSSVGVARNKLMAKLASGRAKPDGVLEVLEAGHIQQLLAAVPAARMPGCGGKVGDTFAAAGITCIADLQRWSEADMRTSLGFAPDLAAKLVRWGRGEDGAPVAERPPPKTLSVQMSLTPVPLAVHPSQKGNPSVAGDKSDMLEPLPVGAPNYRRRSGLVVAAMAADLLGRVLVDRDDEGRWPSTLTVMLRFMGGGADNSRFYTRSTGFPSPSLATAAPPQPLQQQVQASVPSNPGPIRASAAAAAATTNIPQLLLMPASAVVNALQPPMSALPSEPRTAAAAASSGEAGAAEQPASLGVSATEQRMKLPSAAQPAVVAADGSRLGAAAGSAAASSSCIPQTAASWRPPGCGDVAASDANHYHRHRQQPQQQQGPQQQEQGQLQRQTQGRRQQQQQQRTPLSEHAASGRAVGSAPETALEAALVLNVEALCRASSSLQPPAATLVEVRMLATNFIAASTASGPSIRSFFSSQPGAKRQRTGDAAAIADANAGNDMSPAGQHATATAGQLPASSVRSNMWSRPASCVSAVPTRATVSQAAAGAVSGEQRQQGIRNAGAPAAEDADGSVDLAAVDVAQQHRILQQLQVLRQSGRTHAAATSSIRSMSGGGGDSGGSGSGGRRPGCRKGEVSSSASGRQQGIREAFRRAA